MSDRSSLTSTEPDPVSGNSQASDESDKGSTASSTVQPAPHFRQPLAAPSGTCPVPRPPRRPPAPSSSAAFHHSGGYSPALSGISPPLQPQASITESGKRPVEGDPEDPNNKKMKGHAGDEVAPYAYPLDKGSSVDLQGLGVGQFFKNYHQGLQNEAFNVGGTSSGVAAAAAATNPIPSGAQDNVPSSDVQGVVNDFVQKHSLQPVVPVDALAARIQEFGNKHQDAISKMRAAFEQSKKMQQGDGSGTKHPPDN